MVPSVVNVAGEQEREARTPRENALEALCLACGTLVILWPLAFGVGVLGNWPAARTIAEWVFGVLMFWMLIGSPLWHRDTAESLGFGNPIRLWRTIQTRQGWPRWRLVLLLLSIFGGLLALSFAYWPHVARFFWLPEEARTWPQDFMQWTAMSAFSVIVAGLVTTCAIRYDNIVPSLRLAATICIALVVYSGLAAGLHRGTAAFDRIQIERLPLEVIGYAFWGYVQQIAFTAYFATRLRKGFAPGPDNISPISRAHRLRRIWMGGVVTALTLGAGVWFTVRSLHGPQVPLSLLPVAMLFAFPIGVIWTHFYCLDKRRILVATLSGSFFGIIHADSYGLVLVTAGLGTIFAYASMEDRFRNLAAFALVHGFLGSTFSKLFRDGGILRVKYRVGPWSVQEPSADMLIVPVLCIFGYVAIAFWVMRHLRSGKVETTEKCADPLISLPAHKSLPK